MQDCCGKYSMNQSLFLRQEYISNILKLDTNINKASH